MTQMRRSPSTERARERLRRGWFVPVFVLVMCACFGVWSVVTPAAATGQSGDGPGVAVDAAAEVAAWTRVVEEGQRRVFALTGEFVPLPVSSSPAGAFPAEASASPEATSPTVSTSGSASPSPPAADAGVSGGSPGAGGGVGGWYAGSSGSPVTEADGIRGVWSDTSDEVQRTLPALSGLGDWAGAVDIAVAGTVLGSGEDYAAAAAGAYDERWRAAAAALAAARGDAAAPTFVRPWHEMNGDWYAEWVVTAGNVGDYRAAFARYAGILRAAMPQVLIVWSPNDGTHTELGVAEMYPGDDVVDVIAPDSYDWTPAEWGADRVAAYIARGSAADPAGVESWRLFALEHGKPMGLPEWGLCRRSGCGGDHPAYITAMHTWMSEHANTATWRLGGPIPAEAAGKVLYSVYFNTVHEGDTGFTLAANPDAAGTFAALPWGSHNS